MRPLALGLLDGETRRRTEARLVESIKKRDYHIGTGFLSTPFVLPVLTGMGRTDLAYKMLETETAPGWLAEVKAGATTVWENWDGSASQNHYSPGAMCEWLFTTVGGIEVSGVNEFAVAPRPGGSLAFARTRYVSVFGEVGCEWEKCGENWKITADIPANTSATLLLPTGEKKQLTGGARYEFSNK